MRDKPFLDTDVLMYSVASADKRAETARALLAEGGVVSVQVLNEFVAVAQRKLKMSWDEIIEVLTDFNLLCPVPIHIDMKVLEAAIQIAERYGVRLLRFTGDRCCYEAGCDILYSEDMQGGQKIGNLTILTPF